VSSQRPLRHGPDAFERRERLRAQLFSKQGGLCHLCGKPMKLERNRGKGVGRWFATFDHVVPASEGGTSYYKNLKLAHRICNNARNSRPLAVVGGAP
jgi:5-methylcytosine-specific restriction endonuclease McrA